MVNVLEALNELKRFILVLLGSSAS